MIQIFLFLLITTLSAANSDKTLAVILPCLSIECESTLSRSEVIEKRNLTPLDELFFKRLTYNYSLIQFFHKNGEVIEGKVTGVSDSFISIDSTNYVLMNSAKIIFKDPNITKRRLVYSNIAPSIIVGPWVFYELIKGFFKPDDKPRLGMPLIVYGIGFAIGASISFGFGLPSEEKIVPTFYYNPKVGN